MKRFLSLLLVFALVLSCTPVLPIQVQAATEEQSSFDGYTAISTKEELDAIRNNLNGKYYLTADIVFADEDFAEDGTFYNNGAKWIPIGTSSAPFTGIFDGNGHTITGLSVLVEHTENAVGGLFGYVSSSNSEYGIFNLGMISDYILVSNASGTSYAGSVAGYCETGKIEGCYHTGHVAATNTLGEIYAGGVVGYKQYGQINKCYNTGSVVGGGITGGIVGGTTYASVSNCYNNTEFDGKYAGGIVGSASFGTVDTCYSLGTNSSSYGSGFAGGIVGMNSNCTVSNSYYTSNTSSGGGTYKSTSAMQSQSTFSGFDFTDVWTMDGNSDFPYPELQGVTMHYKRTLTSISVSTLPSKTVYWLNEEELDVTGGVVKLTYNDGSTSTVSMTAEMVTGFDSTQVGQQTLTVTHEGKTATFKVTVKEPVVLNSIAVTTMPAKTEYIQGEESLDVTGGIITLTYSDGSTSTISMTAEMVTGFDNTQVGQQTLTVTHEGKTATFDVTVKLLNGCGVNVTYTLVDGTLTISGTGAMADYATASESPWYGWRESIVKIVIEDGVTSIGDRAFYNCTALTHVTIGADVASIGSYAFRGCTKLTEITLPASVTELKGSAFRASSTLALVICKGNAPTTGTYVFTDCAAAMTVQYYEGSTGFDVSPWTGYTHSTMHIGEWVIDQEHTCTTDGSKHLDCSYCNETITEVIPAAHHYVGGACDVCHEIELIASGNCGTDVQWQLDLQGVLTIFGSGPMAGYDSTSSSPWYSQQASIIIVDIKNGVTNIGKYAFYGCSGLTSIVIPDSVTSIGDYAFASCSGLTSIVIPDSVTSIGSYAFSGCNSLVDIYITDLAAWLSISHNGYGSLPTAVNSLNKKLYLNGELLTDVVIPDSVTSIGDYAFASCSGLTSIVIPDSVTSIGSSVFKDCIGLTSIVIPDSVTSIGEAAFNRCTGLSNIVIPDSVTSISSNAFSGCTGLTSVTLGNSVTTISAFAFSGCTGLTSITIPDSVTTISTVAFDNCSIQKLIIAEGSKTITSTIVICESTLQEVVIPDGVTSIGDYAFTDCTDLTSITIPDSVTSIGKYAFSGCNSLVDIYITDLAAWLSIYHDRYDSLPTAVNSLNKKLYLNGELLTDVVIPDSVTSIGDYAFRYCDGLTSIVIPDSVTGIGRSAFKGCTGLTGIVIPDGVTSISSSAFEDCTGLTSIVIPDSVTGISYSAFKGCAGLTSIVIPDGVTGISPSAFEDCTGLTSIVIPDSVTSIGEYAFYFCHGLTNITIPDSVTSIGEYAFRFCHGLTSIVIPDSVTSIGEYTFSGCTGLTNVTIPNSVTSIGKYAFSGCTGLTSITIPDSVTSIGKYAFSGCTGLTSVTIPNSVTSIGEDAFWNCTGLTSVTIPNSVTSIGDSAFSGCTGLTSITIPDSVTSIGYEPFEGCTIKKLVIADGSKTITWEMIMCESTLQEIVIPDSVTNIDAYAFSGCNSLTDVYITDPIAWGKISFGNSNANPLNYANNCHILDAEGIEITELVLDVSVKEIPSGAFEKCRNLTSITIPDGITSIGNNAFDGCTGLTSITIPDSVTSIGVGAFEGCTGLTSITIPDSVTSIGAGAFEGCTGLTSITIPDSVTSIGDYAFRYCDGLTSIVIPDSVTYIGNYAFKGCSSLSSVTIGNSVTDIDYYAFEGCTGLTSITIPDSVTSIGGYAFKGCRGLTNVTIGNSVTDIGDSAFEGCSSLSSVTIGKCVTNMGKYVFINCYNLTDVYITDPIAWCKVSYNNYYQSNPLYYADNCHILDAEGIEITDLVLDASVEKIPLGAFKNCRNLTSITIPDSVTSIGYEAFSGCTGLVSITIPDSVTSIGYKAFSGCTGLTSITIPDSVTSISSSAFEGCTGLTDVYITDPIAWGKISFGDSCSNPLNYANNCHILDAEGVEITELVLDASLKEIPARAFWKCRNLTSITIPDSVTSIGEYAFADCTGLTNITIPDSVTSIGYEAFKGCTCLTDVYYGGTAQEWYALGDTKPCAERIHYSCKSVEEHWTLATVAPSCTEDGYTTCSCNCGFSYIVDQVSKLDHSYDENHMCTLCGYIGGYCGVASENDGKNVVWSLNAETGVLTISGKGEMKDYISGVNTNAWLAPWYAVRETIKSVIIEGDVQSIGNHAFLNCYNLRSITIPNSVINIGDSAFSGCSSLMDITIPNSVMSIGSYAFASCESLTNILIPSNVASIERDTFFGCSNLQRIIIPNSVTYIGDSAFMSCRSLRSITIPDSVSSIAESTFQGCSSLANVELPQNLTRIHNNAFYECTSLTNIVIPDNVFDIDARAFLDCKSLRSITIPSSVISIGDEAFVGCSKLTVVFYSGTEEQKNQIWIDSNNIELTSAQWHYEVSDAVFAKQECLYCTVCNNYFLPNGEYVLATVIFKDWNGDLLSTKTYHYGDTVTAPAAPTKTADNTYTYTFAGWDKDVVDCFGNATYTATYTSDYINYTVKFLDEDGTVLSEKTYHYGDKVTAPADPQKAADNTYTYAFAGWDNVVVDCAGNATYTATYTSDYINYTVKFLDEDGTVLSEKTYHYGDKITAPTAPTKAADKTYTYSFKGWGKEIVDCAGDATYTATYTSNYIDYTIVFKNWNGDVLSTRTYHYGDKVIAHATPTKAADNTYTYTFAGWDNVVVDCAGDATYTAMYTPVYINYTVKFLNADGTVLSEKTYHYGDKVTVPEDPAKAADSTYTYTFAGWGKEVVDCAGDATYTATYTSTYINYTVKFLDEDGTVLSEKTYHYGDKVTAPADPTKAADNTYTYAFAGWGKEVVDCAGDAIYTATYTPNYINYTVKFLDEDGTVLSEKTYHYGDKVTAPAAPTKAADNTYTYTFAGWDKPVVDCAGDATYTATYIPVYINYTVKFLNADGTVLSEKTYHYGDKVTAPTDPTKTADETYTYSFKGWDKEIVDCAGDATYTATYTPTYINYTVKFLDEDGTVLSEKTYHYGDKVTAPADPTKAADNTYTYAFAGWGKEVVDCAGDSTYTATYTPNYINYTVKFLNGDGTVLSEKTYHYGDKVTAPADPTKAADKTYTYSFKGWDKTVVDCAGDATYTATYTSTYINYTVKFLNGDGTVLSEKTYHYGDKVTAPANPTKAADKTYTYSFKGWDKAVVDCAGDATYTATYTPNYINYTVTFLNADGSILSEKDYHYGDAVTAPTNPAAPDSLGTGYAFDGWDKEITVCQGNAVYTAKFVQTYILGDLDQDERVNNKDVEYLLWHTLFPEQYPITGEADFNGDGTVNNKDVEYLLWHTLFPQEYPLLPKKKED